MDVGMEVGIFLAYACGIAILYCFGRLLVMPVKLMGRLLLNSAIGGVVLILLNLILKNFGISFPINIATSMVTGLLGLPGIVGILLCL